LVGDRDAAGRDLHAHGRPGRAVAHGVVDQVSQQHADQLRVSVDRNALRRRKLDLDPLRQRGRGELGGDLPRGADQVESARRLACLVGLEAREGKELVYQPRSALAPGENIVQGMIADRVFGSRARHLRLRLQCRERRA